MEDQPINIYK